MRHENELPMFSRCPLCNCTVAIHLGCLGRRYWYRCRDCGMEWSERVTGPVAATAWPDDFAAEPQSDELAP